jgi:uncharacterized protein YbcC (UPF0753/DUF2309 family)
MSAPTAGDEVSAALAEAAHVLPAQGPIEVFVHHNTLHAYQSLPFHQAIACAEEELGAQGYLDEAEYRAAYAADRISDDDVRWAIARFGPNDLPEALPVRPQDLLRAMMHGALPPLSRDVLEVLRAEGRWASSFDPGLDPHTRRQLVIETTAWLDEALRADDSLMLFARRLVGPRVEAVENGLLAKGVSDERARNEALRRALRPLGLLPARSMLDDALRTRGEALSAYALWGACVELFGWDAVLAPAPFDIAEFTANQWTRDFMVPLCASFLDRGMARWTMPRRELGMFAAFRELYRRRELPLPSWLQGLDAQLEKSHLQGQTAEDLVREIPADRRVDRLKSLFRQLPGWGGMFHRLELFPVPELPNVRLVDFAATMILVDECAHRTALARTEDRRRTRPLQVAEGVLALYGGAQRLGLSARDLQALSKPGKKALVKVSEMFDRRARTVVWQEAYERHHEVEVIGALRARPEPTPPPTTTLQALFCIDEREESFRRHLEEVLPSVRTFGVAGFFGVAVEFLPIDDVSSMALCPVGVTPGHRVEETPHPDDTARAAQRKTRLSAWARLRTAWRSTTRSVAGGGAASLLAGPIALAELAARVLAPRSTAVALDAVERALVPPVRTVLSREREQDETHTIDGRLVGFTFAEKAQRVKTSLENVGLTSGFAPLVLVVAHGSSSLNNPHRSAYDCGACGGRNGGPNARMFARMANRPQVREALRALGVDIPAQTHFLGAVHDTATDAVTFFDEHAVPESLREDLVRARATLDEVSRRNAHERCRRFASAPVNPSLDRALRHVQGRAVDVSQARPELGHATNAVAVIGRRALTRGLFLDRRSFLVSYDPAADPTGGILERILAAVGPVGAGINLEYYFSRVDNERLGCGTKLPHNLVGHLGVMNGASSDLRTGLPKQMIEIHEPVRLLMVLDAEVSVIEGVAARQPAVRELVVNRWVRVVARSPSGQGWFAWRAQGFERWDGPRSELPTVANSRLWYEGHDGFRGPSLVQSSEVARVA